MRTFSWGGPQQISFFQLHGLSPALKSLHLASIRASVSEIISLTYCFPLLEDLSSHSEAPESHPDGWATYSTLPKLSGSLLLHGDNRSVTRGLLRLPCGLHFSDIRVTCSVEDFDSRVIMDLVSKCSDTLESLCLVDYPLSASPLVCTIDQSLTATRGPSDS